MARYLDIGPGPTDRIPGFEGFDATPGPLVDHIGDCRKLPFPDNTFVVVHSSHVLEHVDWWETADTVREWARVVKPGGRLEVWVPNGRAVMEAIIAYEDSGQEPPHLQPGKAFARLHKGKPYEGLVSILMNMPFKGNELQRHRSIITPVHLAKCMHKAGLYGIRDLLDEERRGFDHGWFNLGMVGFKP